VSTQEPGSSTAPGLTALPRVEDLPTTSGGGYDADKVRDAFDAFRRHSAQLQAQLRVLQAAGRTSAHVEPTGHSVRMDALHLIRAAAEFADTLERDAQNAASAQLGRTEEEVSARQHALQDREAEIERYRQESERQRAEILNASKAEARELLANAHRDASQELREAEARGSRLLEQSRHQATELTNSARAEVEQTLAQQGAEQLLRAAGLGEPALGEVADAILAAARESTGTPRPPHGPAVVPPVSEPVSEPEAEADEAPIGGPAPVEEAHEAAETEEPEERQPPAADAPPAPPVSAPPLTSPPPPPVSPLVPPPVSSQDEPAADDEDEGEPGERA
jgi:hypothetical protein